MVEGRQHQSDNHCHSRRAPDHSRAESYFTKLRKRVRRTHLARTIMSFRINIAQSGLISKFSIFYGQSCRSRVFAVRSRQVGGALFEQLSLLDTGNFHCRQRRLAAQGCVRQPLAVEPGATMQRRFQFFAGPQVVALQSFPGPPVEAFDMPSVCGDFGGVRPSICGPFNPVQSGRTRTLRTTCWRSLRMTFRASASTAGRSSASSTRRVHAREPAATEQ